MFWCHHYKIKRLGIIETHFHTFYTDVAASEIQVRAHAHDTCYLIPSTFSHAARVLTLARYWSRSQKPSLNCISFRSYQSSVPLRQGGGHKSLFSVSEDRGSAEEEGCRSQSRRLRWRGLLWGQAQAPRLPCPSSNSLSIRAQSCRSRVQCFPGIKDSMTTIFIYWIIISRTFSDL